MLPADTTTPDSEITVSERRLAANRANAQFSTGPRTEEGKAKSSLNAVKTGLAGRTVLLADEEEAAYRAHVARFLAYWEPADLREHALVQSLADTQWRLEAIPGLKSGVYVRGRLRYAELYAEADPTVRRVLLDAHVEDTEAKTLKNLRLHERRLSSRYQQEKAELERLRRERLEAEAQQRREAEIQREREEQQRRQELKRAERRLTKRKKAREEAASTNPESGETVLLDANGFEFSTLTEENPAG